MWKFVKKHWSSFLLGMVIVVLFVSPNAKSWVLKQIMYTGIFNAKIQKDTPESAKTVNLQMVDEKGEEFNTSDLNGKVVFINFWASWCPPCRAEMPSIKEFYKEFSSEADLQFLMVNEGEALSKAQEYLKKEDYRFPIYKIRGQIPKDIYSGVLPTTVILDKTGAIRYHHKGVANYNSESFYRQVRTLLKE